MGPQFPKTVTEPARCGLRVFAALVLCMAAACSTPPRDQPAVAPPAAELVDRTAETGFRLDDVARQLRSADLLDGDGETAAASAMLDMAREKLPPDYQRERRYLDALQASVWGRAGDKRDAQRAETLLQSARAGLSDDPRLMGEIGLAEVAIRLGADDTAGAVRAATEALAAFETASALFRMADACREAAAGLFDYGMVVQARDIATRGARVAESIDEHTRALRAWLDAGVYGISLDAALSEEAFLHAYSAAYRTGRAPWRSVVVATAVQANFDGGANDRAVAWADRIRDADLGLWPNALECGLGDGAYALLSLRYALALPADSQRRKAALKTAIAALEAVAVPTDEAEELGTKARAALLQIESGK